MFEYNFTYWDDLPANSGLNIFGMEHLSWLIGIAAADPAHPRAFIINGHDC